MRIWSTQAQQQDSWEDDFKPGPSPGERTFTSTCSGCHGLDGRGGERAPNIASNTKTQRLSDAQLSNIIANGVSGTGMPAFHSLSPAQLHSVVHYLRTLQGKSKSRALPGDPSNGEKIFLGKGECSTCHSIAGKGGFLGPDLSGYGMAMPAQAILAELVSPNRIVPSGYKLATATTTDGTRVEGIVRNEDNFSVQMQAKDGSYHFFQKSDLRKLEYHGEPLMPTDYGKRLSRAELNDLVSYLMNASSGADTGNARAAKKDSE
ncbi:MAG TPA: c-type cytochrome [Candidatus Dormibacteraeota bacterium]|nr:c-type cytochrome [Candidatus Dormibacteraeota bacterium]